MASLEIHSIAPSAQFADGGTLEAKALKGNRSAWDALVALHGRRVELVLLSQGILPAEAYDLAQEAWERLILQSRAGALTFLKLPGLAIRQALFLAKGQASQEFQGVSEEWIEGSSPETSYLARDQLLRARAAVARMQPSAREVFGLLYGHPGYAVPEVAARLGLSIQRVRQIVCEIRKVLRMEVES